MITTEKWSRELKLNMNLVHLYKDRQCCYKHKNTSKDISHFNKKCQDGEKYRVFYRRQLFGIL